MTNYPLTEKDGIKFIDLGIKGEIPLVLLHGLFGTASNFDRLIAEFSKERRILMPILPIFEMSLRKLSLGGLLEYVEDFIKVMKVEKFHLLGNSLGGHIALLYAIQHQDTLHSLTLTGSSGLYESSFGTSFPKREDYEYIRRKVSLTFYEPEMATKEMVDEVFDVVNNRSKAIRIVKTAKSAIRHNVEDQLSKIEVPTLLVWGEQDTITPKFVGEKFNELIIPSRLVMVDKCGHAPMLERPGQFNAALHSFLEDVEAETR
ncbi:MAG: alpha/beta fold hydrolase [Saprospiraceae bacterium]|nr:alpha/beta fold hydrolase [Saprospiraceae bacterium]